MDEEEFGPWNPGLNSSIPGRLLPLVTLYRAECSSIDHAAAMELSDFCGLPPDELIRFHPNRLVLHEVLVQISTDYYIPDGQNYEDFGLNLRGMAAAIIEDYLEPHQQQIETEFDEQQSQIFTYIRQKTAALSAPKTVAPPPAAPRHWWQRLLGSAPENPMPAPQQLSEIDILDDWSAALTTMSEGLEKTSLSSLIKVVGSIIGHRSRLVGDISIVEDIAVGIALNQLASERLSEVIRPYVIAGAAKEGYQPVPAQAKPVVMNVKGASAAGKSTIRPQQKLLAAKLDIPWQHFAVISPDYWRKYLLDYASLGDDFKYAAMLTGQELELIDKKLDRYMAQKADAGNFPNLIIDRFRFDSFETEADSRLLTRFGDMIFMMFVITAPEETVERAWQRGISTGRYKPVDDLLFHNVEAFTGIPQLYFSWASSTSKQVHFEFLDNNVAPDETPKTIAFGWNDSLTILDLKPLIDIDRGRHLNIDAASPAEVFAGVDLHASLHTQFLHDCTTKVRAVNFADQSTGQIFAVMKDGEWSWCDVAYVKQLDQQSETFIGLQALGIEKVLSQKFESATASLEREQAFTLGQWLRAD